MEKKNNEKILDENLMSQEEIGFDTKQFFEDDFEEDFEGNLEGDYEEDFEEEIGERLSVIAWFQEQFYRIKDFATKEPTNDLERYKLRISRGKFMNRLKLAICIVIVLVAVIAVKYAIDHHTYLSYEVVSMSEKVDAGVLHSKEMEGNILHYSGDGVSLTSTADNLIWTDSYQMSQPVVETFGSVAAVYDLKGTQIAVYDENGKLGAFQTEYPIMKASVSAKGEVAAILENGENTLINYYTETGSLIASSSTNMRSPGYPVDLSVSEDGLSVVVTYFVVDEDTISSYLAFYNFGEEGRKKEDNLLDGFRFAGVLVPEVQYLDNDTVIAYREDGFSLYKGKNAPKEVENIVLEDDIVSSFGNDKYIGFVFRNNDSENPFSMKVYNTSGKLKLETDFSLMYDDIKISGNQIIINNSSQIVVYSIKGIEKYNGIIEEGNIHEVVKVGMNRYTVAYNGGVITIKLK